MNFSIPTLLVLCFCLYTEYQEQKQMRSHKAGQIYYLKNVPTWVRIFVYTANTGIGLYNYLTHYDDYLIAGMLILSTNAVVNISKLVVASDYIAIGNTKLAGENFQLIGFTKLSEKQSKFSFEMTIRKKKMKKDLFVSTADVSLLTDAIKRFKGVQK